jgi:type 1 glutamine amidotransferase
MKLWLWLLAAPLVAAPPLQILILTGQSDTQYHDWRATTPFVKDLLERSGRFEVRVAEEPRGVTAETLAPYDAVLVNYNGPRWGSAAEAALEQYVRAGKGVVSFHGVTYGPLCGTVREPGQPWTLRPPWQGWLEMLGATWKPEHIGHAPRGSFHVKPGAHPILNGMPAAFTVNDELYHRIALAPGVEVIATAFDEPGRGGTGKDEPMAWVNRYGAGRVFHTPLGHDTNALYQPNVMALLARATEWAASGQVTLAAELHHPMPAKGATRVLVVTGGHSYTPSFYDVFQSNPKIRWTHAASQKEAFTANLKNRYDVIVLYDMANDLAEAERKNLREYVEAGKGVVSLHHAIVDYTAWPWWHQEAVGGKYYVKAEGEHPASAYKEGVPMLVRTAKGQERHPIVRGVGDLVIVDECYRNMWRSPKITVLMETANELNDRPVVYTGPTPGTRVVYIQLGHGAEAHHHPGYRKLVANAIEWAAGKTK